MSGTPVLGTRRGALPEIVTEDVGALGDTLEDLVRLRETITSCEPEVCRAHAERCSGHAMSCSRPGRAAPLPPVVHLC
jgi:hypothetical protein